MFDKVKDLLVEELSVNPEDVTLSAELVNDLGINSLELADLVLLCEEKFDIEIGDDAVHKFITVGDVVDYLNEMTMSRIQLCLLSADTFFSRSHISKCRITGDMYWWIAITFYDARYFTERIEYVRESECTWRML